MTMSVRELCSWCRHPPHGAVCLLPWATLAALPLLAAVALLGLLLNFWRG